MNKEKAKKMTAKNEKRKNIEKKEKNITSFIKERKRKKN